jgi:hypothetical protein
MRKKRITRNIERFRLWVIKWKDLLPLMLTGLIFFITCVYTVFSFLQWRTMERTIEIGNRAYVSVDKGSLLKELKVGEPVNATVNFVNKGNTPALKVKTRGSIGFTADQISEPMQPIPGDVNDPQSTAVIAKDGAMYAGFEGAVPLDEQGMELFNQKKLRLYIWGVIEYEDMFGKPHKTSFCFTHPPEPGISLEVCPINNTAD